MGKKNEGGTLRDGNGRSARLARWLMKPPVSEAADTLLLEHKQDGEWTRLLMWPREEVSPVLSVAIDEAITELANELGAYLTARVVWWSMDKDQYFTGHDLRVQPEGLDQQQAFSGDPQSANIQTQRHLENSHSLSMSALQLSMASLERTNKLLSASNEALTVQLEAMRGERSRALLERDEAVSALARAETIAEDALAMVDRLQRESKADDGAQTAQVLQLVGQVISGGGLKA